MWTSDAVIIFHAHGRIYLSLPIYPNPFKFDRAEYFSILTLKLITENCTKKKNCFFFLNDIVVFV